MKLWVKQTVSGSTVVTSRARTEEEIPVGEGWVELEREPAKNEDVRVVDQQVVFVPKEVPPDDPRRALIADHLIDILLAVADGSELKAAIDAVLAKETTDV